MLLWSVIFLGAFIMLVSAIVVYIKAEDLSNDTQAAQLNAFRTVVQSELKKLIPADELKKTLTDIQDNQKSMDDRWKASLEEKSAFFLTELVKIRKDSESLKARQNAQDRRGRFFPASMHVSVDGPVLVDLIKRQAVSSRSPEEAPKPITVQPKEFRKEPTLLERAGIGKSPASDALADHYKHPVRSSPDSK